MAKLSESVEESVARRLKMGKQAERKRKIERVPPPRDLSSAPVLFKIFNLTAYYSKKYRREDKAALRDVSFTVKESQFIYVMGLNGSGKTTLLNVLQGKFKGSVTKQSEIKKNDKSKKKLKPHFFDKVKSPTKGLRIEFWDEDDHRNCGALGSAMRIRSENGQATMIVSHHDIADIFNHADKIMFLHKGELLWFDTPAKTIAAYEANKLPKPFVELIEKEAKKGQWDTSLSSDILLKPR